MSFTFVEFVLIGSVLGLIGALFIMLVSLIETHLKKRRKRNVKK